ncbi:hypothetical protein EDB85DRAFT_1026739 [Lactarius pseudohatsudake]|nr:hypothetical protein EDB85DRAFT_1026739 [Lactarius pseudohatsudake]
MNGSHHMYCLCNLNVWEMLAIELGLIGGRELKHSDSFLSQCICVYKHQCIPPSPCPLSFVPWYLLASGRAPLGFRNLWLYHFQGLVGLNDITSDSNTGCSTDRISSMV